MRIVVTGDRFWICHVLAATILKRLIDRYGPELTIVHGDATGVDDSFGTAAKGLGLTVEAHPAAWDEHGDAAGPIRNSVMVRAGADLCIALHRFTANSRGTKDCVGKSPRGGNPGLSHRFGASHAEAVGADDDRLE